MKKTVFVIMTAIAVFMTYFIFTEPELKQMELWRKSTLLLIVESPYLAIVAMLLMKKIRL